MGLGSSTIPARGPSHEGRELSGEGTWTSRDAVVFFGKPGWLLMPQYGVCAHPTAGQVCSHSAEGINIWDRGHKLLVLLPPWPPSWDNHSMVVTAPWSWGQMSDTTRYWCGQDHTTPKSASALSPDCVGASQNLGNSVKLPTWRRDHCPVTRFSTDLLRKNRASITPGSSVLGISEAFCN